MNISDRSVSRSFRNSLAVALPRLADNRAYWRMTQHLLFGTSRDLDTSRLLLPGELIAAIEDKRHDKNYVAMKFLDAYRRDVMDFEIAPHVFHFDSDRCKARSVMDLVVSEALKVLVRAERRSKDPDRVWMSSGNTALRKHTAPAGLRPGPRSCPLRQRVPTDAALA